jgi:hypothetical protein
VLHAIRHLQVIVSLRVDRGLLHESSVVRIQLRIPRRQPRAVTSDPLLQFPSERGAGYRFAQFMRSRTQRSNREEWPVGERAAM